MANRLAVVNVCLKVSGRLTLRLSLLLLLVTITEILTWVTLLLLLFWMLLLYQFFLVIFETSYSLLFAKNSPTGRYMSAANRVCEVV